MLVIMEADATPRNIDDLKNYLISKNFDIHQSTGQKHVIIGVIGDVKGFDTTVLENMNGVQQVVKITEYKKPKRG